ncbi:MAG: hypothetical protein IPM35_23310 [Myxococcales bacterium]|nr:hypothetical protein [Myxococcales bacterium]
MGAFDFAQLEASLRGLDRSAFDAAKLARAAEVWAVRAQNEHASVASFDRFSLGLLAVAAPPELLVLAHEAALEEIVHARMSFAIAGAYAADAIGPGPLDLRDVPAASTSLPELVESTVIEGCVGETLSALEARLAAGLATEPAARLALDRIAEDEARHAELAWAFVRWAVCVERGLGPLVRRAFDEAVPRALALDAQARCMDPDLNAFGIPSLEQVREERRRGVEEIVAAAQATLRE